MERSRSLHLQEKEAKTMDEFLLTRLSLGPVRDEILQILKRHRHPHLVSKNINELTEYMNSTQDSPADRSEEGISHGTSNVSPRLALCSFEQDAKVPLQEEINKDVVQEITPRSDAETVEQTIIQDSPVLKPKNLCVLSKIINNLDPSSFVRLARTCKEMNQFCFNNKDILIPCWYGKYGNARLRAETMQTVTMHMQTAEGWLKAFLSVYFHPEFTMARTLNRRLQKKKKTKKNKAKTASTSIFDGRIRDVLPNILSQTDASSFVRLARTCKQMNQQCLKKNQEPNRISCWGTLRKVSNVVITEDGITLKVRSPISREHQEYAADCELLKRLKEWPFDYCIQRLHMFASVDDALLTQMRNYFSNFPRVHIRLVELYKGGVENWQGFVDFLKEIRAEGIHARLDAYIPPQFLPYITQNMSRVVYNRHVPDDVILGATAKALVLDRARISTDTFKQLIKKFVAGDIKWWRVGRGNGSFIVAMKEAIQTKHMKHIFKSAMKPSTIYTTPSKPGKYYVLKSDGSLSSFDVTPDYVEFGSVQDTIDFTNL